MYVPHKVSHTYILLKYHVHHVWFGLSYGGNEGREDKGMGEEMDAGVVGST
jgi:hypothetical protein